jgi:hypothetical protein
VVDAGKEVGVVADRGRQAQSAVLGSMKNPGALRLDPATVAALGVENLAEALPQRHARFAAEREQRVERRSRRRLRRLGGSAVEQAELERGREIEDLVADCDAAAGRASRRREHAERQVLDREVGVVVCRGDPAAPPRPMGVVDHGCLLPGLKCLRRPCQQSM